MKFYVIWSLVWFFVFAIQTYSSQGALATDGRPIEIVELSAQFIIGLFLVSFSFAPSTMFSGLKTKQQRIGYFSLPATNLEKYVSSFVVTNVGVFAIMILGGLTADILRFIFKALIGYTNSSMVMTTIAKGFVELFNEAIKLEINGDVNRETAQLIIFTVVMGGVYSYTLYLLGGSVFRKSQWLWTSIAGVVLMMTSIAILNKYVVIVDEEGLVPLCWMLSVVFVVLSIFNVWASYKVFTRMEVINNKWLNL